MLRLPANYRKWITELKDSIQQSQASTQIRVNADMLILYWYIGKQLEEKIELEGWGAKIIDKISTDLQKSFPDIKGFSSRNLLYMKQFSAMWPDLLLLKKEITQQAAAQIGENIYAIQNPELISIPWGHHIICLIKALPMKHIFGMFEKRLRTIGQDRFCNSRLIQIYLQDSTKKIKQQIFISHYQKHNVILPTRL